MMSTVSALSVIVPGVNDDLESSRWEEQSGHLRGLDLLDVGFGLLVVG